jgi:hypothetical protein
MTTDSISSEVTAVVQAITQDIESRLSTARGASEASLQEYRAIGEALIKAKPLLPGRYLKWAKETFGFGKQWCSNLTILAAYWNHYQQAKASAEDRGQLLTGKAHSVDGAVALIKGWKKASDPSPEEATTPQRPKLSEVKANLEAACAELDAARVQIQERDAKVAEALARISDLEAQLAALGGGQSAYASGQTGTVDWTSPIQDVPSEDVAADAVHVAPTNEEGRLAVTIRLGRSEHEALIEDATANDTSLEALLLAKILGDTSDQGAGPWPREATELEKLLQRKGVGYVIEERIRTIGQEDMFGPDEGTVIRTYSN